MTLKSALSWTLISVIFRYGIKLLGNLTLARLLTPTDFGLSAIVVAVVTGIEAITDVGTKPALIRTHRDDAAWLDTAWTMGVVRGILIAVFIAIAANPLSEFIGDPRLAAMIIATASMSVLIGFTSIDSVTVVRDLKLKQFALLEILSAAVGYGVMLFWAWLSPTAWALLAGAVVSTGTFTIASFFAFGRRPARFRWDKAVLSELTGFGRWVFFASVLGFVIFQGDRFAVAKLVSVYAAGLYAIAVTWSITLQSVFSIFLSRLYLPIAAQLWRGSSGADALRKLRRSVLLTMIIPFAFAAGCASAVINFLYPTTYIEAGPVMCVLVIGGWFSTLEYLYNDQLMVSGEPRWRFVGQIISAFVIFIGLLVTFGNHTAISIAAIFSSGAAARGMLLMYVCERSKLRSAIPDIALTAAFAGLALCIAICSQYLMAYTTPLFTVMSLGIIIGMPFAVLSYKELRNILELAGNPTVADPGIARSNDIGLDGAYANPSAMGVTDEKF